MYFYKDVGKESETEIQCHMKTYKTLLLLCAAVVILTSCTSESIESKLMGKWLLVELSVSSDGGATYEQYPLDRREELILLENGFALYTDEVLYTRLDTAEWYVSDSGDSLEIRDHKHEFTGKNESYEITQLYTKITSDGEMHDMMDLTIETVTAGVFGLEAVKLLMSYEKILSPKITINEENFQLLKGEPKIFDKFIESKPGTFELFKYSDMQRANYYVDSTSFRPVLEETPDAYKILWDSGNEFWVQRNRCIEMPVAPITRDVLSDFYLNWERYNNTSINYNQGNLKNLSICFFNKGWHNGNLEIGLLDDEGHLIRPLNCSWETIPTDKRGLSIEPNWTSDTKPRIYYGKDYQLKDRDHEGLLNPSKLSRKQIMEIWRVAQGDRPDLVYVYYYFPERNHYCGFVTNLE